MVALKFLGKKSLESRLSSLEERMYERLSKRNFEKIEKLIPHYNSMIDRIWSMGPSKYPLQKIKCVDKERAVLKREIKCMFCGSDGEYVEVLPYLFGTIKFIDICQKKGCQNAFEDYKKRYLGILDQAHGDLSE